jgi:hypothetical protein
MILRFSVSLMMFHYTFTLVNDSDITDKPKMNTASRKEPNILCKKEQRKPITLH